MNKKKKEKLEKRGWKFGDAEEFLDNTFPKKPMTKKKILGLPNGWAIERYIQDTADEYESMYRVKPSIVRADLRALVGMAIDGYKESQKPKYFERED